MATRFVVLLAALLVALPAPAQDQFEEATRATAAACVEHLRQEQLPPCVLALQRQIRARALAHCHDDQPECAALLEKR